MTSMEEGEFGQRRQAHRDSPHPVELKSGAERPVRPS
jgi:hypothetical protein